jgi:hypothetical protein
MTDPSKPLAYIDSDGRVHAPKDVTVVSSPNNVIPLPLPTELQRRVDQARAIVESSRQTHIEWIDHLEKCPDCPDARIAGDVAHHREAIEGYDFVLEVLDGVEDVGVKRVD